MASVDGVGSETPALWPVFRLVAHQVGPYWRSLAVLAVLSTVGFAAEAGALLILVALATTVVRASAQSFTAPVLGPRELGPGALVALGAMLVVGRTLVQAAAAVVAGRVTTTFEYERRRALYEAYVDAGWETQALQSSGGFLNLMLTDIERARACVDGVARALAAVTGFISMLAVALFVSWQTAGVMVLAALGLAAVVAPLRRGVHRYSLRRSELNRRLADEIGGTVSLIREVRAFGVRAWFVDRMEEVLAGSRAATARTEALLGSMVALYQGAALLVAICCLGAVYRLDPKLVTRVGPVVLLLLRSLTFSQIIQQTVHSLYLHAPYLELVGKKELELVASAETASGEDVQALEHIVVEEVSYSYRPGAPVLQRLSLEVHHGELLGLIGPSGGGKSTLVQLLLRLRRPDEGRLLADDLDAGLVSPASWARLVSYVPQEPVLLDVSILENIRFGRPWIADERIRVAAEAAGIAEEIGTLPHGYDTPVGERGARLSGGQRQRLCIARALAGDPAFILFDEPTSALDAHSELAIRKTLAGLRGRVGVIIVAHRISTLEVCDRVAILQGGRIEAEGPPGVLRYANEYFQDVHRISDVEGPDVDSAVARGRTTLGPSGHDHT